jgi:hypothetical protein
MNINRGWGHPRYKPSRPCGRAAFRNQHAPKFFLFPGIEANTNGISIVRQLLTDPSVGPAAIAAMGN